MKVKGNWIAGAIRHPGALHRELGIPQGKKIPAKTLQKAAGAGGVVGRRARLAETLGNDIVPLTNPNQGKLLGRDRLVITPAMVKAGEDLLWKFDPEYSDRAEYARRIFLAMLKSGASLSDSHF